MTTKYHVSANAADFGIIDADSEQEARDEAARMAGYQSEADMVAQIDQPSELIARNVGEDYEEAAGRG